MIKTGIVGTGYFGQKLHQKLQNFTDVVFFTGRELDIDYDVDWVIIASSTDSHYELCKLFLNRGVNVFVEKPMTLSYNQSKELVDLSKENGVRLYVDDIFMWHPMTRVIESTEIKDLEFYWNKYGSFNDNIFNNLTYHDLYLALHFVGNLNPNITIDVNRVNEKVFWVGDVKFSYNRVSDKKRKYVKTNGFVYDYGLNADPLEMMLKSVLNEEANFEKNLDTSLKVHQILDELNGFKPKVAVVGAGIFGISSALKLDGDFDVTLYEKTDDILKGASSINQYRLHRGYHYPRSIETAVSAKKGTESFIEEYPCEISNTKQHYVVASQKSKVNSKEYESFMDSIKLKYEKVNTPLVNKLTTENTYLVDETLFDPCKLYELCMGKLINSQVTIIYKTEFTSDMSSDFDYVINCTYSNLNEVHDDGQMYQYEVCEKPILKLSDKYKGIGVIIMDGPFMCIDPYSDTEYHVMGNVVEAIHETNVGKSPVVSEELRPLLNKGLIKNPPITKIDRFIETAKEFLDMDGVEHIGSMFTIRTVLANRDHDDARPSIVKKHSNNMYSIFSGKISTAVDTSNELYNYLMKT